MLARFVDQRRLQAASLVALGFAFPLVLILGIAAAAMTTLRRGLTDGVVVVTIGVAFVAALMALADQRLMALPILTGIALGGVVMARVLASSASLSLALQVGLALGFAVLAFLLLAFADPGAWWQEQFIAAMDRMTARGARISEEQRELWLTSVPFNAMPGMMIGMALLLIWGGLFIGRAWQASLVNPGGFRQEFHQLRLGRWLALGSAFVFFADALVRTDLLLNVAAVLLHVWIVQGLALIHWAVGVSDGGSRWLVTTYVLLVIFWITGVPLAVLVPMLGVIGEVVDLRGAFLRALERQRN